MMHATVALTVWTKWEDKLDHIQVWNKVRYDHPGIINPVKAKDNEDRQIDLLTFNSINEWTDTVKNELIHLEIVKDEPGYLYS